jgi:hypothetical protein
LAGVVVAGRPSSRQLDDGRTLELLRLTTTGERNACSRLYAAACRAAWALGYRRVVTYTLEEEPGTSLRAAGFRRAELTRPRTAGREWHRSRVAGGSRLRLWDEAKMPMGRKVRWERCAP